jgi:hypothetical protein
MWRGEGVVVSPTVKGFLYELAAAATLVEVTKSNESSR